MVAKPVAIGLLLMTAIAVEAFAHTFYIDPRQGSPEGDGSARRPWRTLREVLDAGLVETRMWSALPYEPGATLQAKHEGAPVKAGDTLLLRDGYYGDIELFDAYNEDYVTVAAQPGHTPRLRSLHVRAAAGWIIRGLSISPGHAPVFEATRLAHFESHGWRGPVRECVLEACSLFTVKDASGWSKEDWDTKACSAVSLSGDVLTARGNTILNVNFGISVSGDSCLVEGNRVENFSGDGLRGLGDYGVFRHNVVLNCYDVNANHDDGFQSWSRGADGTVGTGEVRGIVLEGNTIINYTDPAQPFRGTLQGIGCFDGMFVDWLVRNNVIITDHWHGITLSGARNCHIVNNTVIDLNDERPGPPRVRIGKHKNGTASSGCVVRNNLTTAVSIDEGQEVVSDHNLIVHDQEALFVDAAARDVHLKPGSEAIDAGSDLAAPAMDIEGVSRPQGGGIDIGAYEFLDPGTVERGQAPLRAGSGVARVWMVPFGGQREIAVEVAAGTRLASSPRLRLIDRRGRRVAIISLSPATPRRWRGVLPEHGNLATGRYLIRVPTDEGCIRGSLVLLR